MVVCCPIFKMYPMEHKGLNGIKNQVVPLLAISFSDYEHDQWNSVYKFVGEEGSFSHAHINTKLFCQYLGKYSCFDYLYYYTTDEHGF